MQTHFRRKWDRFIEAQINRVHLRHDWHGDVEEVENPAGVSVSNHCKWKKNIISDEDKDDDNDSDSDNVLRLLHDEGVEEAAGSNVGHLSHV